MQKGQIEATGQIGLVSGIGTHPAFGASVGTALNDRVLVSGEFLYIPLGSSTVRILGTNTSVSAKAYSFALTLVFVPRIRTVLEPSGMYRNSPDTSTRSLSAVPTLAPKAG